MNLGAAKGSVHRLLDGTFVIAWCGQRIMPHYILGLQIRDIDGEHKIVGAEEYPETSVLLTCAECTAAFRTGVPVKKPRRTRQQILSDREAIKIAEQEAYDIELQQAREREAIRETLGIKRLWSLLQDYNEVVDAPYRSLKQYLEAEKLIDDGAKAPTIDQSREAERRLRIAIAT